MEEVRPVLCSAQLLTCSIPDPSKQEEETPPPNPSDDTGSAPDGALGASEARSGSKGMSPGAIAGTVVGVVLGVLLLATIAICLWRRRRRGYDDMDDIQDDTRPTPYVAPLGPSDDSSMLGDHSDDSKQPRPARPRRVVQREEDAGAIPGDDADPVEVDVLPPLYREEWNAEDHGGAGAAGAASDSGGSVSARRRPSGPQAANSPGSRNFGSITAEEIKFLGAPVTTSPSDSSNSRHIGITPEELKLLGGRQQAARQDSSQSSLDMTSEDIKFLTPPTSPEMGGLAPEAKRQAEAAEPERPAAPQRISWQEKGKGVMSGERTT